MMSLLSLCQRILRAALLVTLTLSGVGAVRADDPKPFLHPLFTDNMVLQRGIPDPVWGWATPGQIVTVRVAGKGAKAVAGADGEWMARLPPLPVGGPYTLTVSGPQTVTLSNILVGDVWLCSGQSDMSFAIGQATNGQAELAAANYPQIRLFYVPVKEAIMPSGAANGSWMVCTPQTAPQNFSAVGYFFCRDLQQDIHVPIGMIESAVSGTVIESWTSAEALNTVPEVRPRVAAFEKVALPERTANFDQIMEPWYAKHDPGSAVGKSWGDPALDTSAWKTMAVPQVWKTAGGPELAAYKGTVWFRRTFDLPVAWAGKDLALHLGQINERDLTFINGAKVGQLNEWWQQRDYTVPSALLKPGLNVIAIRVLSDDYNNGGLIGPAENMHLQPAGDTAAVPLSLTGAWQYALGVPLPADDLPLTPIDNDSGEPTVLYNGMIAPLMPFGIKGVAWYQGGSNWDQGKLYRTLLPTLIKDWRGRWGQGDFPFLIVQLANGGQPLPQPGPDPVSELREAQFLTAKRVPNSGLVVTIDIGTVEPHPPDKQDVGSRLAIAAEGIVYGQKTEYSGPIYQSMTVEGSSIRLKFSHLGGGLVAKGGNKLTGFAVAGADGHFVWADAKIDGPTVVVSAPTVTAPAAVRYAWAYNPVCNFYNRAGLPASPFRTDTDAK